MSVTEHKSQAPDEPIGCFVLGYVVSRWVLRTLSSGLLLHGTLLGMTATAMYFALVFTQPDGLYNAIAVYGAPLFWFSQAMRIAGCMTGAVHRRRSAAARLQTAVSVSAPDAKERV